MILYKVENSIRFFKIIRNEIQLFLKIMESPSKEVDVLHEDEVSVLEKLKFNQNI
jgi:hypothetical protein